MNNFWRAIRLTFKHKWNIFWVVLSSICLALCWSGNITAVYPLVQISFQGDSIRSWLDKEIVSQTEALEQLRRERDDAEAENANDRDARHKNELRVQSLDAKIATTQNLLDKYRRFKPIVDAWTPEDPFWVVVLLMVFVIATTLVKSVCTFFHSYMSTRLGLLGALELRRLFFSRMLDYETTFYSQRGISDATTRFTSDMGALSNGLTLVYGKALREPLKMIACLIGAAWVSWRLLLFTFLFVPLAAALIRWLAKSLKRVARRAMAEMAQLYARIDETFRAIKVVKSFNGEERELERFQKSNLAYYRRGMKTAKYDSLTSPITECLGIGMLACAIVAGSYLIIYQKTSLFGLPTSARPLDLGSLVLFYGFLIGASDPARRLSDVFSSLQNASAAADRVYEIVDRQALVVEADAPKRLDSFKESIVFDSVSYEYPIEGLKTPPLDAKRRVRFEDVVKRGVAKAWRRLRGCRLEERVEEQDAFGSTLDARSEAASVSEGTKRESRRVLNRVSLEIKCGETLAIVGRSGCGKSTLTSMIPRFIDPTEGRVLIDGIPLTELKLSDVRDQIGLVSQDSALFNDSAYENIRYGRPDATKEEVEEAARAAYADDFIRTELADGYDTIVGPGGGALSGGQRQRIALARAMLKNPRILLLDEATSQIDLQSERYIHEALRKFVGGRTTILVTHRLTAIELADRVAVMQDGAIQFVGTHEEALKASPFYANLWAGQALDEEGTDAFE